MLASTSSAVRRRFITPGCALFGPLPLAKVAEQLAEADVFCLPSYFEPSPVAVVEAMHHGLPAVGTRVGGMPDRIIDGETGWLVKAGDIPALARALTSLLDDPALRHTMGDAGRRLAAESSRGKPPAAAWRRLAFGRRWKK